MAVLKFWVHLKWYALAGAFMCMWLLGAPGWNIGWENDVCGRMCTDLSILKPFFCPATHNRYALCVMATDSLNRVGSRKNRCIMMVMHYDHMHYENFYRILYT